MATNPEFNQNSNQAGDQSANNYTNVWDYFGDIGLNDQELADVMNGQPADKPDVAVDAIGATADKVDSPTGATARADVSAEYRSDRLQPVGERGEVPVDTASTVVKIDHSPKPDSAETTTGLSDAKPEVTAEPTTAVAQEPIVAEQPTESSAGSAEQPTIATETVEPRESAERETDQIDEMSSETDADESEQAIDEHEAERSPYTKEELEQYRLPDNAEEAKAQGLLESFEENGLGHSQVDEVVRFALKNPGGVRVTLNDDQKSAFEGWMKDHSDWMDGDDARRVWRAVAPDSEKWRDPANPDDDVSKSIEGGFANPTNLADGKVLLRSQQSADGKVVEKQGKAMPASARFVNKIKQAALGFTGKNDVSDKNIDHKKLIVPRKAAATALAMIMASGVMPAAALGETAVVDTSGDSGIEMLDSNVVLSQKQNSSDPIDLAIGSPKLRETMKQNSLKADKEANESHQDEFQSMTLTQLNNIAKSRESTDRHYNASNLPAADYHMWGHDNGDGTYDCSFKKTASSFTGEIDTSSQESITKHVMESCESTPEQLAGMSVALLPQDVLEQNGYNGNVNDFADHLKDDNEARANVLNAFREVESKVNYQHATLEEGTVYKSWGISRTSSGEMVLLVSGNRIVRSGGKDVLIANYTDHHNVEHRMVVDPDCDNLIEIQVNEEGEVVQSRTVHRGGGDTVVHQNGGGGGGEETPPPGEETPPPGEEDESKHASNVFKRQQGSQDPVSTNDSGGSANNPTGRTSHQQPGATVTSPGGKSGDSGNASGSGSGGNKSSGNSQSTTTVKTPSGSSVTGTGGTSNQDGTRTNADATVRGKDGSTETAKEARKEAVEADGSDGGINHGTVDIAGQD